MLNASSGEPCDCTCTFEHVRLEHYIVHCSCPSPCPAFRCHPEFVRHSVDQLGKRALRRTPRNATDRNSRSSNERPPATGEVSGVAEKAPYRGRRFADEDRSEKIASTVFEEDFRSSTEAGSSVDGMDEGRSTEQPGRSSAPSDLTSRPLSLAADETTTEVQGPTEDTGEVATVTGPDVMTYSTQPRTSWPVTSDESSTIWSSSNSPLIPSSSQETTEVQRPTEDIGEVTTITGPEVMTYSTQPGTSWPVTSELSSSVWSSAGEPPTSSGSEETTEVEGPTTDTDTGEVTSFGGPEVMTYSTQPRTSWPVASDESSSVWSSSSSPLIPSSSQETTEVQGPTENRGEVTSFSRPEIMTYSTQPRTTWPVTSEDSSTVWSSTNSPLIASGSEETSGFRRSTTESSPTSEGTSTDWPGSGDEPSTTVEESSVIQSPTEGSLIVTDTEEAADDSADSSEESDADWPGIEDLFNIGGQSSDESNNISLRSGQDDDFAHESPMESPFAKIVKCPCKCVTSQHGLYKATCDCFETDSSLDDRCDLRQWRCANGSFTHPTGIGDCIVVCYILRES